MNTHARRAIAFTGTPTDSGRVEYDVAQNGVFTLGFATYGYPHLDDMEQLHVAYGRWDDEVLCGRTRDLPHAPTINGVRLTGSSVFDPHAALAHLSDPRDWSGWLTVHRKNDRWTEQVPWRTKERVAYIIARLVESFLDREDLDELLAAHRANHAAERIARHQENLRRVDLEIQEWTARRAAEQSQLARQLAFAARLTDPIEEGEPPIWRDYANAATRDGEMFLISTVGSHRPR